MTELKMSWKATIAGCGVGLGLIAQTLTAALPLSDSFEFQPNGSLPAGSKGWGVAGSAQAWVTNSPVHTSALIDWAFNGGVGYPISDVTHTQVMVLNGSISNVFGSTGEQSLWFDFMLDPQAWTGAAPPALSASALCSFYVTPEGDLALARSAEPGLASSNLWTVLSGAGIVTDAWSRITVQWVGGVDTAFFSLRINGGSPLSHVSGWTAPDETAPRNGPWFPCPNATARLTPSSLHLAGRAHLDDWSLSNVHSSYDPAPIPTAVITLFSDPEAGSISPEPLVEVPVGGTPQFEVQALPYHYITDLFTNGVSISNDFATERTGRFEFVWTSVPAGWHTVEALFAPYRTLSGTSIPWLLEHYSGIEDFEEAAGSDTDGDTVPAWMEYLAGTDPTDPNSFFQITGQGVVGGSNYLIWVSRDESGLPPFVVRRKTSLSLPWQEVGLLQRFTQPTTYLWFDSNSVPGAYYRIEVQSP
jgi:hypothetical protein